MELLLSDKFRLPTIYFISDRNVIKELPIGVPFIFGDASTKPYIIRILEFEILYQKAVSTGLPFNFRRILEEAGYKDLKEFWYTHTVFIDYKSDKDYDAISTFDESKSIGKDPSLFKEFVKDSAVYVDIRKIKDLHVFPLWLDKIEDAVRTNIHNFAVYNPNMYNKKLEGVYGSLDLTSPDKNLIIIDISGSIPKAVSTTCLILSKNLAETFYADLLITGSKSTLYEYEKLHMLNVQTIYDENGMDNDQTYFKELLSKEVKNYKTAIVFGDNHHPGRAWDNDFNHRTKYISDEAGKNLCKWSVDKIISFHTTSSSEIAGYARWFEAKEIENVSGWVTYLNN
jgi:hypothetical protein